MFEGIAKRRPRHGGRGDSECGGRDDRCKGDPGTEAGVTVNVEAGVTSWPG